MPQTRQPFAFRRFPWVLRLVAGGLAFACIGALSSCGSTTASLPREAQASSGSRVGQLEQLRGVNLAGADFGNDNLPGEFGVDYIYPTVEEIDVFLDSGMSTFRLPFLWERLQPTALDPFDDEIARIDAFVEQATGSGATVILDPHNYARYYGQVIGTEELDVEVFVDLWSRLASRYRENSLVVFGLMNEPYDLETELWLQDANAAIMAIRDAGANNLILVPGNDYSGAHAWDADWYGTPNSQVMLGVVDPGDNYAYEVHQYLDVDSSGTSPECVDPRIGSERLTEFSNWLRDHDAQAFLGEFASGDNSTCLEALDDMLGHIDDNSDVWLGWTYWAAGPWWGDDMFEIESNDGLPTDPQMDVLQSHLGGSDS